MPNYAVRREGEAPAKPLFCLQSARQEPRPSAVNMLLAIMMVGSGLSMGLDQALDRRVAAMEG